MKMEPPPHLQALLDAFVEVTGMPVTMSCGRAQALTDIASRGLTPDDMRGVLRELKRLVEKKPDTYTPACLTFRNAVEDVDRFEDRALQLRQRAQRRRGAAIAVAKAAETPVQKTLPDGRTETVLAPGQASTQVPKLDVQKALRDFADKLGGRQP